MSIEIKTPVFPESVSEGEIAAWHKEPGDSVNEGDVIAEIETDKVVMEVYATKAGTIGKHLKASGDIVTSEELLTTLEPGVVAKKTETVEKPEAKKPATAVVAKAEPQPTKQAHLSLNIFTVR